MRTKRAVCFVAVSSFAFVAPTFGNLIQNGNFEAGNTGFTSSFAYMPVSQPPHINQYGVVSNSWQWTNFWNTIQGDHTTGQGLFMIADVGSTNTIWEQTVAVNAGTDYTLSAWLATWTTFPAATLAVEINGQIVSIWNAPGTVGPWVQSSANWNSGGATSATIRFYATQVFQPGDDVAIDDIVFIPGVGAFPALMAGAAAFGRGRRRAA